MSALHRRLLGSTTFRLAALIFLLQLVLAGSVLVYVRYALGNEATRNQQLIVAELESDLRTWHLKGGVDAVATEIAARLNGLKGENIVVLLVDPDGRHIAGNLKSWPTVVPWTTQWRTIELFRIGGDAPEQLGIKATTLPGGSHLLTGRVIDNEVRLREISERVILIAFILALPLALFVAAIVSRIIDRRVIGIAETASAVGDGNLSRRVPRGESGDSFDLLADKINVMLARIEVLVGELRIVTSGLAHDLRTPIVRLTATLAQAATEVRDPAAIRAIYKVSTEAENLMSMLGTALQISQAEAGIGRNRFMDIDVAEMLADIAELYEPALEAQALAISVTTTPIRFKLHRELVNQAISNLVDNAMKYAEGASRIDLSAELTATQLEITVADNGVGIAAEDHAAAMRRFGRLDPSRNTSGAGLGLALVEAVARLHDGAVTLTGNNPGLRVTLALGR